MSDHNEALSHFRALLAKVTGEIEGKPLDRNLETHLNQWASPGSELFKQIFAACRDGVAAGWMCNREGGGIRYGRVIKPDPALHGFSVDVVDMNSLAGPHHGHPNGEIDLVMPLEGDARFDGQPAGWKVYEPGSAHFPTVSDGRALVLYLLPQGAIDFTRAPEKST